jgi:hypothetical protein
MAEPFIIKQNDTRPRFVVPLMEQVGTEDEAPIDLTDATSVKFLMREKGDSGPPKVDDSADISDALTGEVTYTWATGDTDTVGEFEAEVEITWDDGGIETVPNASYWDITILDDLG